MCHSKAKSLLITFENKLSGMPEDILVLKDKLKKAYQRLKIRVNNKKLELAASIQQKKQSVRNFLSSNAVRYIGIMYIYGLLIHMIFVFLFSDFDLLHLIVRPMGYGLLWHFLKHELPAVVRSYRM